MSQLTNTEVGPAKCVVAERCLLVTVIFLLADPNLQLMLSPGISDDLPVVDAFCQAYISEKGSEIIVIFFQINAAAVSRNCNYVRRVIKLSAVCSLGQ